jgi:hypothetical protein
MLGFNRWHLFKGLAAILCIVSIVWLALAYLIPAPPSTITIASGLTGGNYERLALRYQRILARSHVNLEMHAGSAGWDNVKLLLDHNTGVQAAFAQGGLGNSEQVPGLSSLGRINYMIFFIFYRATDALDDLTELKGKRIAAGNVNTGSRAVTDKILGISGINSENSTLLPLAGQAAVNAIRDGKADAAIIGLESDSPLIQSSLRDSGIRLLSVTRAEALARFFPSLVRLILPQGAIDFEKKIPASDIVLYASTNAVLVRNDLHPAAVSLLAQALKETHNTPGLFQRAGEFPTLTDPEFPMAEAAVDFYKNGPSFLDKYVPHWLSNYAQRMIALVATAIAIIIPLFSSAPKLYKWLVGVRLNSMYRRLRTIEASLQKKITASQVSELEADLDGVDRAIHLLSVPVRHSDLFFSIKSHIDLVRAQLASRRGALRGPVIKAA